MESDSRIAAINTLEERIGALRVWIARSERNLKDDKEWLDRYTERYNQTRIEIMGLETELHHLINAVEELRNGNL